MCRKMPLESHASGVEELVDNAKCRTKLRPESVPRRKAIRRPKSSIRRNRAHEMARQGMHQRRNERLAW